MTAHLFADLGWEVSAGRMVCDRRGHLFVACDRTSTVIELDSHGRERHRFALETGSTSGVDALVAGADGSIWAAEGDAHRLHRIEPHTARIDLLPLAEGRVPVALAEFAGEIFSADAGTSTLSRVAHGASTAEIFARLPPGSEPVDVTVDSSGWLYAANWNSGSLSIVDPAGRLRADVSDERAASHLSSLSAVTDGALFVSTGSAILRFELDTRSLRRVCRLPEGPFIGFDIVTAGSQLYIAGGTSIVVRIDTRNPFRPEALAFGPGVQIHSCAVDGRGRVSAADYTSGRILRWSD